MLAALGGHFGWSRRELEQLDHQQALFWWRAVTDLQARQAEAMNKG